MVRWIKDNALPVAAALLSIGLIIGGYLLGDGLRRSHRAQRSVSVRGLAERNVLADLAVWTIRYSAQAPTLAAAQAVAEANRNAVLGFLRGAGFDDKSVEVANVDVSQPIVKKVQLYEVDEAIELRTADVLRARATAARQYELLARGVRLGGGSGVRFIYTGLNAIKPAMVAAATKDARRNAEQFAQDSGGGVGGIKSATQGVFTVGARDGEGEDVYGGEGTPFKKVRVVTSIDFYLS